MTLNVCSLFFEENMLSLIILYIFHIICSVDGRKMITLNVSLYSLKSKYLIVFSWISEDSI
jgi:hypothetical protein